MAEAENAIAKAAQLTCQPGMEIELAGSLNNVHVFEKDVLLAINAALAARRPLLVRGEPGVGKSQLARAAAQVLRRPLLTRVVDQNLDAKDLLWEFDAVARLAEAQIAGVVSRNISAEQVRRDLAIARFVSPGPLWWALNWPSALAQVERMAGVEGSPEAVDSAGRVPVAPTGWKPKDGTVVLLDEIDKGDVSFPNGLLECLGERSFLPVGARGRIEAALGQPSLVIITTNDDRALPDAFLRRCLVLHMELPRDTESLVEFLVSRGMAHFGEASLHFPGQRAVGASALRRAAQLLATDRARAIAFGVCPPGQAEFLDLCRAVAEQADGAAGQLKAVEQNAGFVFQKHEELIEANRLQGHL